MNISDYYDLYGTMGEGSFGIVVQAINKKSGQMVALKGIKKKRKEIDKSKENKNKN
jgi:serine/threonine protein kinase